jgi:phosphoglycolate phosphatase-like HAD superfamily hydrolase
MTETNNNYIFDFDGTICTLNVDWKSLKEEVFSNFNSMFNFPDKRLMAMVEQILIIDGLRKELFEIIKKHEQPQGNPLFNITHKKILDSNFSFYVISNNLNSTVRLSLQKLNLYDRCIDIVGLDDVSRPKPNTNPFEILIKKYKQIEINKTIYVGNTQTDFIFANNCKIKYIDILNF